MSALNRHDYKVLAYLNVGALVRIRGEWRFGLTRVGDSVVERLVDANAVTHLFPGGEGECIIRRVRP